MAPEHYRLSRVLMPGVGFLFGLFSAGGPLIQGVMIAGLPKPSGCK